MEKNVKNKKVQLVEEVFGITLPEFKIHVSSREVEFESNEENGVLIASKWNHVGTIILPPELEIYLPKDGMNPEQAIRQLGICSSLARGYGNDSYQLYTQEVMMRFHSTAIKNCIYLASRNYDNWNLAINNDLYLDVVKKEMWILREAFSKERPSRFSYQKEMGRLFLRLLLENNAPLKKGAEMEVGMGRKHVYYNTVSELLLSGFSDEHSYSNHNNLNKYVMEFMSYKCYEVTEQLLQLKD